MWDWRVLLRYPCDDQRLSDLVWSIEKKAETQNSASYAMSRDLPDVIYLWAHIR